MEIKIYVEGIYNESQMTNWLDHVGVKFKRKRIDKHYNVYQFNVMNADNNFLEILDKNNIRYFFVN